MISRTNASSTSGVATILARALAGQTLTATKGQTVITMTYKLVEGIYYYVAKIHEYGAWIISNGSISETVEVSEATTYNVTLLVQKHNSDYRYYYGDEYTSKTGGWSNSGYSGGASAGIKNSDNLQINGGSFRSLGVANPISVAVNDVVAMVLKGTAYYGTTDYRIGQLSMQNSKTVAIDRGYGLQARDKLNRKFVSNVTIGSTYSGNCYMALNSWSSTGGILYAYSVAKAVADDISGLSEYGLTVADIISNAHALLADLDAVEYMIYECTGIFMWAAIANDNFVSELNNSPYKSRILGNAEWAKALQAIA